MEADRRRRFGTVIARKRADGSVGSWLARYASPLDPSRRVQRSFRTSEDARAWLNGEEMLVNLHRRGVQKWVHPTARSRRARASLMKFDELADRYVDTHRKPDGTALRGAAKRNLKTDVQHLKDVFGGMRLTDITPEVVSKWYFGPHDEGAWVFPRTCQRLKAILDIACSDRFGTGMPLLESNPFVLPIPPDPEPKSWSVPPLTGVQLAALYESMPESDRLSVLLAAWAGGMRIGEVCALTVDDFDFEARTMSVNHSVCRGGRVDRVVFVVAGIVDGRSHRVGDLGCIIGDGGLFLMRQFAIMRPAGHVEVDVAGRIAVLVGHHITVAVVDDLPNKVDHVDHVAGGARFVGRRLDAERIVCFSELAFVDVGTFPPLLTCGGRLVENLVVDIGDVAHECDLVAETLEPATYHVECDGGADMADMR